MRINVSELKRAPGYKKTYQLEKFFSPLDFKDYEIEFIQPVKVSVNIVNAGSYFEVLGTINTEVSLSCGRCLEQYHYPVEMEFTENYYSTELEKTHDADQDEDEYIPFTGDYIDIEPEVRNSIQLGIPMRQICKEQCSGLCPQCGVNLNNQQCECKDDGIDPRMAVLQDLFKKK